jgi:hypothetical protein
MGRSKHSACGAATRQAVRSVSSRSCSLRRSRAIRFIVRCRLDPRRHFLPFRRLFITSSFSALLLRSIGHHDRARFALIKRQVPRFINAKWLAILYCFVHSIEASPAGRFCFVAIRPPDCHTTKISHAWHFVTAVEQNSQKLV